MLQPIDSDVFPSSSLNLLSDDKIAIFGISANPPTGQNGHTGVVKYLVQTHIFKEIWVLPVYQHIYSEKTKLAHFEHRMNMCKMSMEGESSPQCAVRVLSIERAAYQYYTALYGPTFKVGTIDVLDFIRLRYPNLGLHLVLGTDTFNDLVAGKWKAHDRILSSCSVNVISRRGVLSTSTSKTALEDEVTHESLLDNYRDCVHPNVYHHQVPWLAEVSSTRVRQLTPSLLPHWPFNSYDEVFRSVHPDVYYYMKTHRLYGFSESYYLKRTQWAVLSVSALYVLMFQFVNVKK